MTIFELNEKLGEVVSNFFMKHTYPFLAGSNFGPKCYIKAEDGYVFMGSGQYNYISA